MGSEKGYEGDFMVLLDGYICDLGNFILGN